MSTIKKLIEFSLDYDIQKPAEMSMEREEREAKSPKFYNTMMHSRLKNESKGSKADLWEEDMV
jgi:hypothetical protein